MIRTAWLYGRNGQNFVHTMLRLFRGKSEVSVVADQWGSPTYAPDLAEVIIKLEFIRELSLPVAQGTDSTP